MGATCLAIIGDYWHKGGLNRAVLEKTLGNRDVRTDFVEDPRQVPFGKLETYDLIVLTKMATLDPTVSKELWYTPAQEREFVSYVEDGGNLVSLHAGLADYPRNGAFCGIMKGAFLFHPQEHPEFSIRPIPNNKADEFSAIDFRLKDEMYFVWVDSADTEILLESGSPDYGSSPAAWRHSYGKGKVFCFTPGHNEEVIADPWFGKILDLGIGWLMG